ncbi:hypothetical protein WJX79_000190 [Trebouxia sp. C0005]
MVCHNKHRQGEQAASLNSLALLGTNSRKGNRDVTLGFAYKVSSLPTNHNLRIRYSHKAAPPEPVDVAYR